MTETTPLPDDLTINAADEIKIRQDLVLTALGKSSADCILRVGRLLDVHTRRWLPDQEIVIKGRRIAWTGPAGTYRGTTLHREERPNLAAVPGFGEVHKHIESSHLTPEYEAALVLPHGNTWTCEASHELSNVDGPNNVAFWFAPRLHGSPMKIFPLPGSAVPPTAYESGGGYYGFDEQSQALRSSLAVPGLDEVMDWPAISNPATPSYDRVWGVIEATFAQRGVVEGHGAGLRERAEINAFAAAGLASDHEAWTPQEVLDKLAAGIFIELRPYSAKEVIAYLIAQGLEDWSQLALTTDDRSANDTLRDGATDYNVRLAIAAGLAPEIAIQMVTLNPARHMRLTPWVGSLTAGRFADIVLLADLPSLTIAEVWADGKQISRGTEYIVPIPHIDWQDSLRHTIHIGRELTAADFAIPAAPGRETMQAAVLRPFHFADDFLTETLPVADGLVQRDATRTITKFSLIDRYSGKGGVARMFWRGCGPRTPDTAVGCSVAHDLHNIWVVGSSDAAMAKVANQIAKQQGGWAMVKEGELVATVRYEIGGLMSQRPAADLAAEMQHLYDQAATIDWLYEPTFHPRWFPGFPERLMFATLTCAPWRWVLVAPSDHAPNGFVNVQTGAVHPIVW
jgi:adenine deaminase